MGKRKHLSGEIFRISEGVLNNYRLTRTKTGRRQAGLSFFDLFEYPENYAKLRIRKITGAEK